MKESLWCKTWESHSEGLISETCMVGGMQGCVHVCEGRVCAWPVCGVCVCGVSVVPPWETKCPQ